MYQVKKLLWNLWLTILGLPFSLAVAELACMFAEAAICPLAISFGGLCGYWWLRTIVTRTVRTLTFLFDADVADGNEIRTSEPPDE